MIQNVEKVIEWLRMSDLEYFVVKTTKADNSKVFERKEDESFEAAISRFQKVMDLSKGGRYVITAKQNKGTVRGMFEEEFANTDTPVNAGVSGLPVTVSGVSEDEVQKRINTALEAYETRMALKRLEEENKELKTELKEADSKMSNFFAAITPHVGSLAGALINRYLPNAAQPSLSIGDIDRQYNNNQSQSNDMETTDFVPTTPEDKEQRLQTALEAWQQADPECFVELIEFIANFAATGEKINTGFIQLDYGQVREMLLKAK